MNATAAKVIGFLAALAGLFGLAVAVGNAVGPVGAPAPAGHDAGHSSAHGGHEPAADAGIPGGLMVSQDGYTFALADKQPAAGRNVQVGFTLEGPDGRPVTAYDVRHDKRLHLIAARRDFSGFQHVHPRLGKDGAWTTRLDLTSGQWRLFADFKPSGADPLTLGADLYVPGATTPVAARAETRTASVDGYTVTLDGDLTPGADAELRLNVSRAGKPVTDLEPYLGAYGHLVALREGDLAYLHVHPEGTPGDGETNSGPEVVFMAAVPSGGGYHLYLDFKHRGVVRTAAFTVRTTDDPVPSAAPNGESEPSEDGHDDH